MTNTDEILSQVREILVDALAVDDDEVQLEATLVGDLGAESIDFLDIVFRLDKKFNIKIPQGELFPDNLASQNPEFAKDGVVTEAGIAELSNRLPFADVPSFAEDPKVENIQGLFTVEMLVKYVEAKVS